ncbi:MAG: sigma-70 family RNA polymerase sigma factor, partial [Clostridia bacterium]|nr:sigma-70 family RNA polymerase sigma factor [Clostridia bacterium]
MDENITTNNPFDSETFARTMLEPLFYFAMSRTRDENEASGLVSDIAEAVLSALAQGKHPGDPQAWVWKIAKNRYARYVKTRLRDRERTVSITTDEEDFDLPDTDDTPEERLLLSEEEAQKNEHLAKLRETLAHIRSDWRQVLVAYYMENRPIREIAASLGLPEGTVKTKLYQSRKFLKEGIFMARTYGKLSYAPENVNFSMSGYSLDQRPWSIITHKLHKNILLAAYRTPSTAEDLAMEMGIALPYMEDELEFLVRETLLVKNGDTYETGFMILSADAQEKMQENLLKITPKVTELLTKAVEAEMFSDYTADIVWHGGYVPEDEIRWVMLMNEVDYIGSQTYNFDYKGMTSNEMPQRPSGKWNLLGFEDYK